MDIDYSKLPEHMQEPFRIYIEKGIPGGSFMTAVLSNDLFGAFRKADDINRERMFDTVAFLYCHAPGACFGSSDHVRDWISAGGIDGLAKERTA